MRALRPARSHRALRSSATAGLACLALLTGGLVAGGLVADSSPARAASIPTNPCVRPDPVPVTTSPVVTRVSTSRRVVDVRRRAKTLHVMVTAHDTVAITRVTVTVSQVRGRGGPVFFVVPATLVAGSPTAGTWRAAVRLPRFIPAGTYRVSKVLVVDAGRGVAGYFRSVLPNAWPPRLQIRSITDRTAPIVTGFAVSARAVDTRSAPRTITVRVRTRDDLSGVAKVRVRGIGVDPARAPTQPPITGFSTRLVRSTSGAHVWVARVVVPMWAGVSTWNLSIKVTDVRGNKRNLHLRDLARRGWPSTLRVTSGRDPVSPSLIGLSFTASTVDARSGAAKVAVSYRVTDAQSGPSDSTRIVFRTPWEEAAVVVTSVTGTSTDRTYRGYVLVPQCGLAQAGTWRANAALYDNALNERLMSASEMVTLGLPTELSVLQRDSLSPWVDRATIPAAGRPLELVFDEPVLMTGPLSSLLRVAVDRVTADGTWTCRNGATDVVVCDADAAAVVTATFTPATAFATGQHVTVNPVTAPPARIGIYDLDGVPLVDIAVGIRVG